MLDTPTVLQIPAQTTAAIRLDIPRSDMMKVFGPAAQELYGTLGAQGVKPGGPLFDYHPSMTPDRFTFELSVPTATPVTPSGRVVNSQVPAGTVARTIYRGPYEGLPEAWSEFEKWIAARAKKSGAWITQAYLIGPANSADSSTWETDLTRVLDG